MSRSLLDPGQILQQAFNDTAGTLDVRSVGGTLVPDSYDSIQLSYINAGNGAGQIGTVQYYSGVTLIATLTLTYDSSNRISSVAKS